MTETNEELLARYARVRDMQRRVLASRDRCRLGGLRDHKSRFAGSLEFLLLGMESKMRERGLAK